MLRHLPPTSLSFLFNSIWTTGIFLLDSAVLEAQLTQLHILEMTSLLPLHVRTQYWPFSPTWKRQVILHSDIPFFNNSHGIQEKMGVFIKSLLFIRTFRVRFTSSTSSFPPFEAVPHRGVLSIRLILLAETS